MRPLTHPSIDNITVEGILHVLADPERAAIFAELASAEGAICATFQKAGGRDIPKSTLSHHFRNLRDAGLIRSERHGVEMRNTTRIEEISARLPDLIQAILSAYAVQASAQPRPARRTPDAHSPRKRNPRGSG